MFFRYGRRIRPEDAHFLLRKIGILFLLFGIVIVGAFEWPVFATQEPFWDQVSVLGKRLFSVRGLFYGMLAAGGTAGVCFVTYRFFPMVYRKMRHRQLLAQMLLENGWYYTRKKRSWLDEVLESVFGVRADLKEEISFPKIYYRMQKDVIVITCSLSMGKFQDVFLELEKRLETGLFAELFEKNFFEGYVSYHLLYNLETQRLPIQRVGMTDRGLRLMQSVYWDFEKLPHMLLIGGTGGGKTFFLFSLVKCLLDAKAELVILDPKNADLADLSVVLPHVYSDVDSICDAISVFYQEMCDRQIRMKQIPNYETGHSYSYYGFAPKFLIFDEYVAFFDMLERNLFNEVMTLIRKIIMLGRQAGFFLIVSCQRPDSKYFSDGIRDQFHFRVALGRVSEYGYTMIFGDTNKKFMAKNKVGRGYVDCGDGVISEFYTPLIPKGYDFLKEIGESYACSQSSFEGRVWEREEAEKAEDDA
ncbi:FtsK/SpoIIIE domain-containing protein [Peptoniphilaceae bacterium SGI.137]